MNRLSMELFVDLIGAPYSSHSRGPEYFDCAGLLMEMQHRQGRMMPAPSMPDSGMYRAMAARQIFRSQWQKLRVPEPGCAVYFPTEAHVGTMIDSTRFLHTTAEFGWAYIASVYDVEWRLKPKEFHRFVGAR